MQGVDLASVQSLEDCLSGAGQERPAITSIHGFRHISRRCCGASTPRLLAAATGLPNSRGAPTRENSTDTESGPGVSPPLDYKPPPTETAVGQPQPK